MTIRGTAVAVALSLSFVTTRPVPTWAGQPAAPAARRGRAAESNVFQGRVVDPDGRPYPRAKLYLTYVGGAEPDFSLPLRATSDADGRFRFQVETANFEFRHLEPWRNARVVALAGDFGPGGSDSDLPDAGRELTIRLARDDVPITGRLVDLEGRPVAGAAIQPESISAPTGGDLTPWINAALAKQMTCYELDFRYLKLQAPLHANFPAAKKVTTGQDGRFVLRGIGRERVVELRVESPSIRTFGVAALTRAGAPVRVPIFHRRRDPWMKTFYPASLDLSAAPSRPIEGVIRDRVTGQPVAGATIRSYRLADFDVVNDQLIRTKTDAQGRFRMTGMPLGNGNEVVVLPAGDQPYLPSWQKLPELTIAQPLHLELMLTRGIWAKGRITDAVSGQPVVGAVRYGAASDNPHLSEAPGLRQVPTNGDGTTATSTDLRGRYRVAVLPGRGLLLVVEGDGDYRDLDVDAGEMPNPIAFVPPIYSGAKAFAEIDVAPGSPPISRDFALDPCRKLAGTVLDPQGNPLAGARIYGLFGFGSWTYSPQTSAEFTVSGLVPPKSLTLARLVKVRTVDSLASLVTPEKPRTLVFQHDGKRLAGFADIFWETKGPVQARLLPWGVVTGRVVDAGGHPRAGFVLLPEIIGKARLGGGEIAHWPERVTTDREGRFRIEAIVPGFRYRLTLENADGQSTGKGPNVTPLKPGEIRDLGDVRAVIPGEPD